MKKTYIALALFGGVAFVLLLCEFRIVIGQAAAQLPAVDDKQQEKTPRTCPRRSPFGEDECSRKKVGDKCTLANESEGRCEMINDREYGAYWCICDTSNFRTPAPGESRNTSDFE